MDQDNPPAKVASNAQLGLAPERADSAHPMCIWCEKSVPNACNSRYDTLTCTHRVIVPTADEFGEAKIKARAAELHECCRMPMEQARELAASEAGPDWYARGQDWGLADALTNWQNGEWTLDDIARAFAAGAQAGAQAGAATERSRSLEIECRCVALEEQADLTAIHLSRMQSALEQTATRSADYLRKAIKAEAALEQARQTAEHWKAAHLAGDARIGELHDEAERMRAALRYAVKQVPELGSVPGIASVIAEWNGLGA